MSRTTADAFNDFYNLGIKPLAESISTLSGGSGGAVSGGGNLFFGECNTAGDVQAKTATISGFTPTNGARVCIKFSYQATVAAPTLNINNTGAYPIKYAGYVIPASAISKNSYLDFVFFNGAYNFVGLLAADGDYLVVDPMIYDEGGNVWAKVGTPIITSENAKFGTALYLDGNSSYLSSTDDFYLGGQDFTIDFWGFITGGAGSDPGPARVFDFQKQANAYRTGIMLCRNDGTGFAVMNNNVSGGALITTTTGLFNRLIHFALVYRHDLTQWTLYINGESVGSATLTIPRENYKYKNIGCDWYSYQSRIIGTIDEFRISDGIARWTENFTPPTEPYTVDEYAKLLVAVVRKNLNS